MTKRCTCQDTTGTVIQSIAVIGDKQICMICHRDLQHPPHTPTIHTEPAAASPK